MIIGVVGLHASGKNSFGEYLVQNYGFEHKDLGQEIRNELKILRRNPLDRDEMVALGNELRRKYGFNYWCKKAIESTKSKNIVISSIRNPSEADEIVHHMGTIVEVFADQKIRFERIIERVKNDPGSHGEVESFNHFKTKEERELENPDPAKQQLLKCISMATYRIDNNGSSQNLYKQIDNLIEKLRKESAGVK